MNDYRFPPRKKILSKSDFNHLFGRRKWKRSAHFWLASHANAGLNSRLGISVSRKIGPSHERNRVKRIIREYFRQEYFPIPCDFLIWVKSKTSAQNNSALRAELANLFKS